MNPSESEWICPAEWIRLTDGCPTDDYTRRTVTLPAIIRKQSDGHPDGHPAKFAVHDRSHISRIGVVDNRPDILINLKDFEPFKKLPKTS